MTLSAIGYNPMVKTEKTRIAGLQNSLQPLVLTNGVPNPPFRQAGGIFCFLVRTGIFFSATGRNK
jgi:hypothetical protein